MPTTSTFRYMDPSTYRGKPWVKIDCPDKSFGEKDYQKIVHDIRDRGQDFTTSNSGFQIIHSPAQEKLFIDDSAIRGGYYDEVESLVRKHMSGPSSKVKKVHIFDHTIRRRTPDSPRQPIQQVHVDQTAAATIARIRRHFSPTEAEALLQGRYAIVNVWRPIQNPASDYPLAVVDWRTTESRDFVPVALMYPKRAQNNNDDDDDDDDRGKEELPDPSTYGSIETYELRDNDDSIGMLFNDKHQFYYLKDMTPEEVMLLKCYDSHGESEEQARAVEGLATRCPHTAFVDPETPVDAPARQSIEVRCLVFWE